MNFVLHILALLLCMRSSTTASHGECINATVPSNKNFDKVVEEGDRVNFTCNSETSRVSWFNNSGEIGTESDHFVYQNNSSAGCENNSSNVSNSTNDAVLHVLANATLMDGAEQTYVCIGVNGTLLKIVKLHVKVSLELTDHVTSVTPNKTLCRGQSVRMSCKFRGTVKELPAWTVVHRNKTENVTERGMVENWTDDELFAYTELFLFDVVKTDAGSYYCSASSSLDKKSSQMVATFEVFDEKPTGVRVLAEETACRVCWNQSESDTVTGYRVSLFHENVTSMIDVSNETTYYLWSGLTRDTSYQFQVSALMDSCVGPSVPSNCSLKSITTTASAGTTTTEARASTAQPSKLSAVTTIRATSDRESTTEANCDLFVVAFAITLSILGLLVLSLIISATIVFVRKTPVLKSGTELRSDSAEQNCPSSTSFSSPIYENTCALCNKTASPELGTSNDDVKDDASEGSKEEAKIKCENVYVNVLT